MSNVIAFLESLGRRAATVPTEAELADAVAALEIGDEAKSALLAGDTASLSALLGGRPTMICALMPADDDQNAPDDDDEQPADDEPKEAAGRFGRH